MGVTIILLQFMSMRHMEYADRKSHMGTVLNLGRAFICGYSRKQRINAKSICEAELVGVSDGVNPAIGVMKRDQ